MIDITLDLRGAAELIGTSKKIQGLVGRTTLNAMRRVVRRTITKSKARFRTESSIGKAVFGKKGSGLDKVVTLIKARLTPELIETGIKLKGLPRLIEEGGKTKPFQMHPYGNKFAKKVTHPGSPVRPHNIAVADLKQASPEIVREVGAALGKLVGNASGLLP